MAGRFSVEWLERHRVRLGRPVARGEIVGIGHVLTEVDSLLGRLARPDEVARMGAQMPRGILLHGPAGSGKTLVARYIASSLGPGVPMWEVSADELSPGRVRGLFRHLDRVDGRSVVYLDEIDLVGMNRNWDNHSSPTRASLVALLAGLDGIGPGPARAVVIASTNRPPAALDRALVRAGRLGFHVEFGLPDRDERLGLLRLFLAGRPVAAGLELAPLATLSRGFTPAQLRQAVDDAAGLALAAGSPVIRAEDLARAVRRDGSVEPDADSPDPGRLERTSIHEAGHVAVAVVLRGAGWVTRVTADDRRGSTTVGREGLPDSSVPSDELLDRVTVSVAGMEAERLLLGAAGLASQRDLELATSYAHRLLQHGLVGEEGPLDVGALGHERGVAVPDRFAAATRPVLGAARALARTIVEANAASIRAFAGSLRDAGGHLVEAGLTNAIERARFVGPGEEAAA